MTDEDHRADVAGLVELWSAAARAYMNGDLPTYAGLARHGEDYTLMPPKGGHPRENASCVPAAALWWAGRFLGGDTDVVVFQPYASVDLAVLVAFERQQATVAPLPRQDWSLRVTLVFRRDDGGWRLVHRHADPLTRPIDPALFAEIARGDHTAS